MLNGMYVIEWGNLLITPTADAGKSTVTVRLENDYYKLRKIQLGALSDITKAVGDRFKSDEWICAGKGELKLLVNKASLQAKLSSISRVGLRRAVEAVCKRNLREDAFVESVMLPSATQLTPFSPPPSAGNTARYSKVFMGITPNVSTLRGDTYGERVQIIKRLTALGYKLTAGMSSQGFPFIAAKVYLNRGTYKIVSLTRKIWELQTSLEKEQVIATAKGRRGVEQHFLSDDAVISDRLTCARVPYVLPIQARESGLSKKVTLTMEYCGGGDFDSYVLDHYDCDGRLLPQYRRQHIALMDQTAQALTSMHNSTNLLHGDVKGKNILIFTSTSHPPEVRLSDFGFVRTIGTWVKYAPGSYPPPECMERLERQKSAVRIADKLQIEDMEQNFRDQGYSPKRIREEIDDYVDDCITGVELTPAIDAWAFGLLLFAAMHRVFPIQLLNLCWDACPQAIKSARDRFLETLNDCDPVDKIISLLLAKDPMKRILVEEAQKLLAAAE